MKSVYIVTEREYSDYRIVGVFDNEKLVDRFVNKFGGDIEEFPINPGIEEMNKGLSIYRVVMTRDGNTPHINNTDYAQQLMCRHGVNLVMDCWAKNEKHAIKIVNEKRSELIASGDWEPPEPKVIDEGVPEISQEEINKKLHTALKSIIEKSEEVIE